MHRTVLIRGTIVEKTENSLIVRFEGSNVFWDETDIGFLGKEIELQGAVESQFQVGEIIIAQGGIERQGVLHVSHLQPNVYQPFGVDWKMTVAVVSIAGLVLFARSLAQFLRRGKAVWRRS